VCPIEKGGAAVAIEENKALVRRCYDELIMRGNFALLRRAVP
jgi:hypothetical protein